MSDIEKISGWAHWLRTGSYLLAGIKISGAFMTWLSTGVVARWFIEKFYPFTRLLWDDFFEWFNLPEISNVQKDALTAMAFFFPLFLSSLVTLFSTRKFGYGNENEKNNIIIGLIFGTIFYFLLCYSSIRGLIQGV